MNFKDTYHNTFVPLAINTNLHLKEMNFAKKRKKTIAGRMLGQVTLSEMLNSKR